MDSALRSFLGNDSSTGGFDLDKLRPPAVAPDFKKAVLIGLPHEGAIYKLKEPLRQKLDSASAVLGVHQRGAIYAFSVFASDPKPYAFVGLHERCVILVSDAALMLLDSEELQAVVAHEIGHEYFWEDYKQGYKRNDDRRLKELELLCDGVAILTLRRAGLLDPAPLLRAAEKITKFNRLSTGQGANAHRYPSADERRKFAQGVTEWAGKEEQRQNSATIFTSAPAG